MEAREGLPGTIVKGCPGRAETDGGPDGSTALRSTERNRPPDGNERAPRAEAAQALKSGRRATLDQRHRQLVSDVTDPFLEGVCAGGPAKRRLEAIVCDARGEAAWEAVRGAEEGAEPAACAANLQGLYIPAKPCCIGGGGNFPPCGRGAGSDGIFVLGAQSNADFLRRSPSWSADGAFRTPLRIWRKVRGLHASESGFHMPR